MKIEGGRMPDTEDYIVFDRTGTPHVVVAVKCGRDLAVATAEQSSEVAHSGDANKMGGRE